MADQHRIRPPAVAGKFYPADPAELSALVVRLLTPPSNPDAALPCMLIVPHAGYNYSGAVAGAGFARVRHYSRVILLGVSHRQHFDGAAVASAHFWQTPLGQVSVDQVTVKRLLRASAAFHLDDDPHRTEHALEVELPFLQATLGNFQIVPLLLGGEAAPEVSAALAQILDAQTLLIVSSDLSHYPSQADAQRVDRQTIDAILSLDEAHFREVIIRPLRADIPGLLTCACGAHAISVAIQLARKLNLHAQLIHYQNSGDISGDSDQVVGYASLAFYRAADLTSTSSSPAR